MLHIHLHVHVCGGGDSRSVVESAVDQLRRRSLNLVSPKAALVLMDFDRVPEDRRRGRGPENAKGSELLQFVYLKPNLEGLFLRMCEDCENRFVDPHRVLPILKKKWPEYTKPMSATAISKRFGLSDLRRAAKHDQYLRGALETIGLMDNA